MKPKVASYFRRGFTMSRNARISHKNNEHPITHWIKKLAIDKETIKKMLVYVGIHQTGLYAQRTEFYRLPKLNNEKEFARFYETFHSMPVTKRKFINYMASYLQQKVSESSFIAEKSKGENHFKLNKPKQGYISLSDLFNK
jgi:hypothetical protein